MPKDEHRIKVCLITFYIFIETKQMLNVTENRILFLYTSHLRKYTQYMFIH